jgi:Na+/H+-dicarboxylate symporter
LTATWFNTLATALVAAGAFAPAAAFMYGFSALPIGTIYMFVLPLVCFALGFAIHYVARALLGRLRE